MSNRSLENIYFDGVKAGENDKLLSEIKMNSLTMIDELDNEEHACTPNEFKLTLYQKSNDNNQFSNKY